MRTGTPKNTEDPVLVFRLHADPVILDIQAHPLYLTFHADLHLGLRAYHGTLGRIVADHGGTLEHFAGDGVMIFFNDPFPVERAPERAVSMAFALQDAFTPIARAWANLGQEVGLGIGIAQGEATLGVIGFEQRWEYAAIGNVPNLAARLCGEAGSGEILVDAQVEAELAQLAHFELIGPLQLRGFAHPVPAFRVTALKARGAAQV